MHGIDLSVNAILIAIERAAVAASSRQLAASSDGIPQRSSPSGYASQGSTGLLHTQQQCSCGDVPEEQQAPHDVTFEVADVLARDFPAATFDVCISRDSLLHIKDKQALFTRYNCLNSPVCLVQV